MYKFMQIYGNCTAIHCLGKSRIRGPVDNVVTKGLPLLKMLLHGDYIEYLKTNTPVVTPREPNFDGDHLFAYDYSLVQFQHNDPTAKKSINELTKRMINFNAFKIKVLNNPDYYFIYSINDYDLDKSNHKMNLDIFIQNIEYLKAEKLLAKVIFVETKNTDPAAFWNFYATNIKDIIKKYDLKYIQINEITKGAADMDLIAPQFYKKAATIIQKSKDSHVGKKENKANTYLNNKNYFGL